MLSKSTLLFTLSVFLAINIGVALWRIYTAARAATTANLDYAQNDSVNWYDTSYVGDNFPVHFPIPNDGPVIMALQETGRYGINGTDTQGDLDWSTLPVFFGESYGRVRLGLDRTMWTLSFYHQLHCLRTFQRAIVAPEHTESALSTPEHFLHCINYLRQTLLCTAADTLEKGDFMAGTFGAGLVKDDIVCQNWENIEEMVKQNYDEFNRWTSRWN